MIEGIRKQQLVAELQDGRHQILSDVLASLGGTDQGQNPHELLESALAACTIITVQMYADRHSWPLKNTRVKVVIDKEGAESHIQRQVHFEGELTAEQTARLLEIANKCPIHRLLSSHIQIDTKME